MRFFQETSLMLAKTAAPAGVALSVASFFLAVFSDVSIEFKIAAAGAIVSPVSAYGPDLRF